MAKRVRDPRLETPTARDKLPQSGKPYYGRPLAEGLHLGYRKNRSGGKWVLRRYLGDERYTVETIASADDRQDANGSTILTFFQAQEVARAAAAKAQAPVGIAEPYSVANALDAYISKLEDEGSKSLVDAKGRIAKHIRPALGAIALADLDGVAIRAWVKAIADQPRHVRGKKDQPSRALAVADTEEERRRRKASANRVLTILKAALNQAYRGGKVESDRAWRTVKAFREVDAARVRYFTMAEVGRLLDAAQGEFRLLVQAALFTGCRYGELSAARVGDFNSDSGTLFIPKSKSGKARHVVLTDEGQKLFARLAAGRASDAHMLTKADGTGWGPSHQLRPMREALRSAKIAGGSFHILRHTAASHNVMGGVPLTVVAANLGHTDTRMTEKHYAHLAPSYVADQLRRHAPNFSSVAASAVGVHNSLGTTKG